MTGTAAYDISTGLSEAADRIEETLDWLLPKPRDDEARLFEAMRYATLGGGKRLRPFLVLSSCRLFGVAETCALRVASAVELVHCYSLAHDDLPSMDDDELRRGKPTTHRQFDEATAILAGDALLTLAFEVLAHPDTHTDPLVRSNLVVGLARAAGGHGMVGGQMMDMLAERTDFDIGQITRLQRLKTGELFAFACEAGAICGRVDSARRHALHAYAHDLGLASDPPTTLLDAEGGRRWSARKGARKPTKGKGHLRLDLGRERARDPRRGCWRPGNPPPRAHSTTGPIAARGAWFVVERAGLKRPPPGRVPGAAAEREDRPTWSPDTPFSTKVTVPADLRRWRPEQTCASWRTSCGAETIRTAVSVTGGHLGAGLGVVELTVALPLCVRHAGPTGSIWDVSSNQCYPHKILTGRRDRIRRCARAAALRSPESRRKSDYDRRSACCNSYDVTIHRVGLGNWRWAATWGRTGTISGRSR